MDVAEHMYNQIDTALLREVSESGEELVDTFYRIGAAELQRQSLESAIKWLERAHDVLADLDIRGLSENAPNLRMCTMHMLVKAYINMSNPEGTEKAAHLLQLMDSEYGDTVLVSLLKLDMLKVSESPDIQAIHGVLVRLFRIMKVTTENFKICMHNINKLRIMHPARSCEAMDGFLAMRLFNDQNAEYMEQISTLRVWTTLTSLDFSEAIESLGGFLDFLEQNIKRPLTAKTVNAIHSIMWKSIEANIAQSRFEQGMELCKMALCRLFSAAGEGNKAKLCRKIMVCSISTNNASLAREAFFSMGKESQEHVQSQFLLYKAALRSNDEELGMITRSCL
jgi:hypothetical protein